jgi:hypothetical protein
VARCHELPFPSRVADLTYFSRSEVRSPILVILSTHLTFKFWLLSPSTTPSRPRRGRRALKSGDVTDQPPHLTCQSLTSLCLVHTSCILCESSIDSTESSVGSVPFLPRNTRRGHAFQPAQALVGYVVHTAGNHNPLSVLRAPEFNKLHNAPCPPSIFLITVRFLLTFFRLFVPELCKCPLLKFLEFSLAVTVPILPLPQFDTSSFIPSLFIKVCWPVPL